MNAFEWASAKTVPDAVRLLATPAATDYDETPRPIGGGQDLLTTMKAYITRPPRVVNLKTIAGGDAITRAGDVLTIGATATLTDIAEHALVTADFPILVRAVESAATPQIRNLGTIGGNLCQRPRCWYFRLENVTCLKRGGDTCYAKDGENKYNAAFGTDAPCVITHPSDLSAPLVALAATVHTTGPAGGRQIKAADFFRMPTADDPRRENVLVPGEIITRVSVPVVVGRRSTYLKFKERQSLDFAMASVAALVDGPKGGPVTAARVVLGGVAPVPWALPQVDAFLAGKVLDETTVAKAAEMAVADARPLSQTGYKVPLVKTLVRRALSSLA